MPDRVDGLPIEVGRADQPGLPRTQKSLMCARNAHASRLFEVLPQARALRRRGTGRASATAEQGLKEWLWADQFPQGSVSINLTLAGFLLTLYRQVGAFAPTNVDRKIMRYAMQDAARQTAYGLGQLRYHLKQPARRQCDRRISRTYRARAARIDRKSRAARADDHRLRRRPRQSASGQGPYRNRKVHPAGSERVHGANRRRRPRGPRQRARSPR